MVSVLRASAERGVLREFEERAGSGGRREIGFRWLLSRPLRLAIDNHRNRLSCPNLFEGLSAYANLQRDLTAYLAGRHSKELPEHRRVDCARCIIVCRSRSGRLTLALDVGDGDWEYATRKLLSLVHEAFVYLNRYWPDYACERLGVLRE